jgi:hypothetical protein
MVCKCPPLLSGAVPQHLDTGKKHAMRGAGPLPRPAKGARSPLGSLPPSGLRMGGSAALSSPTASLGDAGSVAAGSDLGGLGRLSTSASVFGGDYAMPSHFHEVLFRLGAPLPGGCVGRVRARVQGGWRLWAVAGVNARPTHRLPQHCRARVSLACLRVRVCECAHVRVCVSCVWICARVVCVCVHVHSVREWGLHVCTRCWQPGLKCSSAAPRCVDKRLFTVAPPPAAHWGAVQWCRHVDGCWVPSPPPRFATPAPYSVHAGLQAPQSRGQ